MAAHSGPFNIHIIAIRSSFVDSLNCNLSVFIDVDRKNETNRERMGRETKTLGELTKSAKRCELGNGAFGFVGIKAVMWRIDSVRWCVIHKTY